MSEISVSDISNAAGVSRSTFYRSFDTPMDVLTYACDKVVDMLINDYKNVSVKRFDEFILFSLRYWRQHSEILEALVHCDRMDIIHRVLESRIEEILGDVVAEFKRHFTQDEIDYLIMGAIGQMSNMLLVWMKHGKKESPEQIFELYKKFSFYLKSKEPEQI